MELERPDDLRAGSIPDCGHRGQEWKRRRCMATALLKLGFSPQAVATLLMVTDLTIRNDLTLFLEDSQKLRAVDWKGKPARSMKGREQLFFEHDY